MRRSKPWLTALLQLVILIAVVAFATPWLEAKESQLPIPRRSDDIALRGRQARPIFNGSVVPGGVYSIEELRAVIGRDPVVAAHYRAVNVDEMHLETLTAGKTAYVSYRVGDRVFWTRKRLYLKAGETVLTDGHTTIRARCGNCVSDVKQQAVASVEPAAGELDGFVVPPASPETGVDPLAAEAEQTLGDLLDVPFGPQMFASLAPMMFPWQTLSDGGSGEGGSPVFVVPPVMLPGASSGSNGNTSTPPAFAFPWGGPSENGPGGDVPSGPPAAFVPASGITKGDSTTGTSTDDTSGSTSTGNTLTADTGDSSSGVVGTDGTVFPTTTTASASTSSNDVTSTPEPAALWLVAAAVIGVASRSVRKR